MADIMFNEYLKSFGLTGQEATVYEILLQKDEMTGYEISKESGISRSNVYGSLAGLVEKGAAYLLEGEPARYTPVEVDLFCNNTLCELQRRADYLKSHAPEHIQTSEGYITVQGSRHIRDKIRNMLIDCEKRVYMMADASIISMFEKELVELIQKDRKVVILTSGYELSGAIMYQAFAEPSQIRLITDSEHVLTGELRETESDTCLYSRQQNLVKVMKEALRNRILLIENNGKASEKAE